MCSGVVWLFLVDFNSRDFRSEAQPTWLSVAPLVEIFAVSFPSGFHHASHMILWQMFSFKETGLKLSFFRFMIDGKCNDARELASWFRPGLDNKPSCPSSLQSLLGLSSQCQPLVAGNLLVWLSDINASIGVGGPVVILLQVWWLHPLRTRSTRSKSSRSPWPLSCCWYLGVLFTLS